MLLMYYLAPVRMFSTCQYQDQNLFITYILFSLLMWQLTRCSILLL